VTSYAQHPVSSNGWVARVMHRRMSLPWIIICKEIHTSSDLVTEFGLDYYCRPEVLFTLLYMV